VCRETAKERGAGVMADPSGFGKQGGEKAKEMGAGVMVGPFLLPTPTMVLPRVSVTFRKCIRRFSQLSGTVIIYVCTKNYESCPYSLANFPLVLGLLCPYSLPCQRHHCLFFLSSLQADPSGFGKEGGRTGGHAGGESAKEKGAGVMVSFIAITIRFLDARCVAIFGCSQQR
jgi:hypothetical protein